MYVRQDTSGVLVATLPARSRWWRLFFSLGAFSERSLDLARLLAFLSLPGAACTPAVTIIRRRLSCIKEAHMLALAKRLSRCHSQAPWRVQWLNSVSDGTCQMQQSGHVHVRHAQAHLLAGDVGVQLPQRAVRKLPQSHL